MIADLGSDVLAALGQPDPIMITRRAAGSFVDGIFVPGAQSTLSIAAVVQPAPEKQLLPLPEGERSTEGILIVSVVPLQTGDAEALTVADEVSWNDDVYKVVSVEDWSRQMNLYQALAVRVGA